MQAKKSWAGVVAGAPKEKFAGVGGGAAAAAAAAADAAAADAADAAVAAAAAAAVAAADAAGADAATAAAAAGFAALHKAPKNSGPHKKTKKSASAVSTTAAAPPSAWASGEQKKVMQKDGSSDAASTSASVPVAHPARSSDNDSRGQTSRSFPPSSLFESLVLTAPVMLSGQLQKGSSRFFEWPMRSVSVAHGVLSYSKQINGSSVFVDIPLNGRRAPPLTTRRSVMQPATPCLCVCAVMQPATPCLCVCVCRHATCITVPTLTPLMQSAASLEKRPR